MRERSLAMETSYSATDWIVDLCHRAGRPVSITQLSDAVAIAMVTDLPHSIS